MKDPKNVTRNPNLGFYPTVVKDGDVLIGKWIGTIREYIPVPNYGLEFFEMERVEADWAAYELLSGEIMMVDPENMSDVRYSDGLETDIYYGEYPENFPEEWRYFIPS